MWRIRKPKSRSKTPSNVIFTLVGLYLVTWQHFIKVDISKLFFYFFFLCEARGWIRPEDSEFSGYKMSFLYYNKFLVGRYYVEQFGWGIALSHGLCLVRGKKTRVQKEVDLLRAPRGFRKQGHCSRVIGKKHIFTAAVWLAERFLLSCKHIVYSRQQNREMFCTIYIIKLYWNFQ
jgi:hypothetical protein